MRRLRMTHLISVLGMPGLFEKLRLDGWRKSSERRFDGFASLEVKRMSRHLVVVALAP
jgi:hypothetical protein